MVANHSYLELEVDGHAADRMDGGARGALCDAIAAAVTWAQQNERAARAIAQRGADAKPLPQVFPEKSEWGI